jgi:hypothetical protein
MDLLDANKLLIDNLHSTGEKKMSFDCRILPPK